jgi:hypothetical protein
MNIDNYTLKKISKRMGHKRLKDIATKHDTSTTQKEYQLINAAVGKIIRGIDRPPAFSRQESDSTDIPASLQKDAKGNTIFHYAIEKPSIEKEVAILHDMLKKDKEYLQLKAADATTSAASLAVSSSCEAKIIELGKKNKLLGQENKKINKTLNECYGHLEKDDEMFKVHEQKIIELGEKNELLRQKNELLRQKIIQFQPKRGGRKTRRKKTNKRKKKRKSKKRKRRKNN